MALLHGRAGCLTAKNRGFRPGQIEFEPPPEPAADGEEAEGGVGVPFRASECGARFVLDPARARWSRGPQQAPRRPTAVRTYYAFGVIGTTLSCVSFPLKLPKNGADNFKHIVPFTRGVWYLLKLQTHRTFHAWCRFLAIPQDHY